MRPRKRRAVREEEASAFIIPTDILEEILHRLPSNDLLKFKYVSTEWNRLISSPEFIQKHLKRSKAESCEPRIVASRNSVEIEILGYRANNLTSKKIHWMMGDVRLLGSCDGLVLYMYSRDRKIGALNPATGKMEVEARLSTKNKILRQSFKATCTWFGRHPTTGEYVLVIAVVKKKVVKLGKNKRIQFRVYGLSRNTLLSSLTEELDSGYAFYCWEIGTFLHGRLHVTALKVDSSLLDLKTDILAYDLQANKMLTMHAPLKHCPTLGVVDGCLCALNRSQVWIMKEYGIKESWTKYANLDDKISIPLQICPSGDVILCDDFLKAIRDGANELLKCFMRTRVVACIGSLVSPAVVWGRKEQFDSRT